MAVLELGSVERPRLSRSADYHDLRGSVHAAAVDAGGAVRGGRLAHIEFRGRRILLQPVARLRPDVQAGARLGRGTVSPRAEHGGVNAGAAGRLRLLPGLRLNYDKKDVDFNQQTYGGLQTTNPTLLALQRSVLAPQAYKANIDDTNLSGQITAAFKIIDSANVYATYATGFKSVGLNLNGLPTDANNNPVLSV